MTRNEDERRYARALFGRRVPVGSTTPYAVDPTRGNVVPREGSNPAGRPHPSTDVREFAAELFDQGLAP